MSKSSPPSPDYTGAAEATGRSSEVTTAQQTLANRPDVSTPWGSQTWQATPVIDPTTGEVMNSWAGNVSLNPQEQSALDSQQRIQANESALAEGQQQRVAQDFSHPLDFNSTVPFAMAPNTHSYTAPDFQHDIDTSGVTQQVHGSADMYDDAAAQAAYGHYQSLNKPIVDQQREQLQSQLYNEGLKEGDQAYDTAMSNFQMEQDRANQDAGYGAILTGSNIGAQQQAADLASNNQQFGQAVTKGTFTNQSNIQDLESQLGIGAQEYGQELNSGNFQNALKQQEIATMEGEQGYNLSQLNAILNGNQVSMPGIPGAPTAGAAAPVNYSNAAAQTGQAQMNAWQAQQQQQASMEQGAGSLAAMAAMYFLL